MLILKQKFILLISAVILSATLIYSCSDSNDDMHSGNNDHMNNGNNDSMHR